MAYYDPYEKRLSQKILRALADIWPSVYRAINNLFFTIVGFIKDLVGSLFHGW